MLAACSGADTERDRLLTGDYFGGVAGDEPRAVVVARDVLAAGGSAADAAVALYFTAAVTYPASAALGGGGTCLVYAVANDRPEALEFPAIAPARVEPGAKRRNAVPGAVRGMFALHSRYGRLRWGQLLRPAEQLARLGHPVSRALARDLDLAPASLFADPEFAAVFGRAGGGPLREGDELVQSDLAAVLTQLRMRGPAAMYAGKLAGKLIAAVGETGGSLSAEDLRDYRPAWRGTAWLRSGAHEIYTLPPPTTGGIALLKMWVMLRAGNRYQNAEPDERGHLLAEVSTRVFADRAASLPAARSGETDLELDLGEHVERLIEGYQPDRHTPPAASSPQPVVGRRGLAGTSFVVVDGEGSAVACAITLNGLFGVGRVAPGTGIVLAAAPLPLREPTASLAPVMIVDGPTRELLFAGAASGGTAVPLALIEVIAGALIDGLPLSRAVAAPRLHHVGIPDMVVHEPQETGPRLDGLIRRGYTVSEVAELGRVNSVYCRNGFKGTAKSCAFSTDPRGHGLADVVQF